jgi:hypothetical protein
MNIELLNHAGYYSAMYAMRLPKKSTHKGDSNIFEIGEQDLQLATKLKKAGDEHAKCLRGIIIYVLIRAPRYFWQEFTTYRIGSECLSSESTMHDNKPYTKDDFETGIDLNLLTRLNSYQAQKNKLMLKKELPESFLQNRVYMISYQTLSRIYEQRKTHFLPEWHRFCEFIETLDYFEELIR